MTSGDVMKKRLTVKSKNCHDQSQSLLHIGLCEYDCNSSEMVLTYHESEADGDVTIKALSDELTIIRKSEVTSVINLKKKEKTKGTITSPYGSFEMEFYTYFYRISENLIVVEYDVISDMQSKTRFRFSWHIENE